MKTLVNKMITGLSITALLLIVLKCSEGAILNS